MKGKNITTKNYFETVEQVGFENLPLILKQSHNVIMTKTDNGNDWSKYQNDADLKRMINLAFQKLSELLQSKNDLSGTYFESDNHIAVEFIKDFLKMADEIIYREDLDKFITKLQTAINSGVINRKSDFAKEINQLQTLLINLFNGMSKSIKVQLKPETRKMLLAVISKAEKKKEKVKKEKPTPKQDLGSLSEKEESPEKEAPQEGKIMCSTDFTSLQFNTIGFKDKWLAFIGDPAPGFTAMVFGMPKMGKSYLCVDFAGYLARNHGKVLYVAKEEKLDKTLQDKLKDKEVAHENLFVTDALPKDLSAYDFIFLDSVNKLGLNPKDLEKLKTDNKGKSFIYIFQTTKGGKFKGNNEFQHDVDVVIQVPEQGKAVQYGRFNQGGKLNVFGGNESNEELAGLDGVRKSRNTLEVSKKVSNVDTMKNKRTKTKDWTEPPFLERSDWRDLKLVKKYYDEGNFKQAMNYASRLETIVREEIPPKIWKEIGGELTPNGKERLMSNDYANRADDINPKYIFSLTATALLIEALRGDFDLKALIRQELANRGQDIKGNWVGFEEAKKIHKIKK